MSNWSQVILIGHPDDLFHHLIAIPVELRLVTHELRELLVIFAINHLIKVIYWM
jgi:hypothetical protein